MECKGDYYAFRKAMAMRESSCNYSAVNQFGYLGAYQFGMARLCDLGYTERIQGKKGWSNKCFKWKEPHDDHTFLHSHKWQDQVFDKHVKNLMSQIKRHSIQYINTEIDDLFVTWSGAVAGCHLVGHGGFRQWCQGKDKADGNGVHIEAYIELFNGYDLSSLAE